MLYVNIYIYIYAIVVKIMMGHEQIRYFIINKKKSLKNSLTLAGSKDISKIVSEPQKTS